jgi:hypothetical protein
VKPGPRARLADSPDGQRQAISITLRRSLLQKIDDDAKRLGVARSAFIDSVISDYFEMSDATTNLLGDSTVTQAFAQAFAQPGVMSAMVQGLKSELDEDKQQQFLSFMEAWQEHNNENESE